MHILLVLVVAASAAFANQRPTRLANGGRRIELDRLDPEVNLDTLGIILHWGYPGESHQVTTDDGYILTMQRIPYGKGQQPGANRPVIFMQHGLEGQSSNWVTNLPSESAGFLFADQGFDVWLGNFRGNCFGLGHQYLSNKSKEFWQFSWDEMAMKDLPAMINYVLATTQQPQLHYMGHSQGTMTAFALFSVNQTMAAKVANFFALGPVATVGHIKEGMLKAIAPYVNEIAWVLEFVGENEFLPNNAITKWIADYVCGFGWTNPLCADIIFLIGGADSKQLNHTRIPVYVAHSPAGTSAQNIWHFGQQVDNDKFCAFDYGSAGANEQHYHQSTPPLYDPTKVTVPTYLYWGDMDILADPADVKFLIDLLPNIKGNCELAEFNHLDFIWGLRAGEQVYQSVINVIHGEPVQCTGAAAKKL